MLRFFEAWPQEGDHDESVPLVEQFSSLFMNAVVGAQDVGMELVRVGSAVSPFGVFGVLWDVSFRDLYERKYLRCFVGTYRVQDTVALSTAQSPASSCRSRP